MGPIRFTHDLVQCTPWPWVYDGDFGQFTSSATSLRYNESEERKIYETRSQPGKPTAYNSFILHHISPAARRFFIKETDMEKVGRKFTKSWHLWLFSDCIICASILDNGAYHFERRLNILTCSASVFQSAVYTNALEISDMGKPFVVFAPSKSEQMEWLGLVLNATASLRSSPTSMIELQSFKTTSETVSEAMAPKRRNSWGIDVYDGAVGGVEYQGVISNIGLSPLGQCVIHDTPITCHLCDQIFGTFKYRHECIDCGISVCAICSYERKGIEDTGHKRRACDDCWMPTADNGVRDTENMIINLERGENALTSAHKDGTCDSRLHDSSSSTVALFGAMSTSLLSKVSPLASGLKKAVRGSLLSTPPPTPPRTHTSGQEPGENKMFLSPKGPSPIKPPRQRGQGTSYPIIAAMEDSSSSIHSSFEFNIASGNFSSYVSTCVSIESTVIGTSSAISSAVYTETVSSSTTAHFLLKPISQSSSVFECTESDRPIPTTTGTSEPRFEDEIFSPHESISLLVEKEEEEDKGCSNENKDSVLVETGPDAFNSSEHSEWDAPVFISAVLIPATAPVHSTVRSPTQRLINSSMGVSPLSPKYRQPRRPSTVSDESRHGATLAPVSEEPILSLAADPPVPYDSTSASALSNADASKAEYGHEYSITSSSSFGVTSPMFAAKQKKQDSMKKLMSSFISLPKSSDVVESLFSGASSPQEEKLSSFRPEISPLVIGSAGNGLQKEKADALSTVPVEEKCVLPLHPPYPFPTSSSASSHKSPHVPVKHHIVATIKSSVTNAEPISRRGHPNNSPHTQSSAIANQDTPLSWQKVVLSPPGPRGTLVERRISQFNSPNTAVTFAAAATAAAAIARISSKNTYSPPRNTPQDRNTSALHQSPSRGLNFAPKEVSSATAVRTSTSASRMEAETEAAVLAQDTDDHLYKSNIQLSNRKVDAFTDLKSDDTKPVPFINPTPFTDSTQPMETILSSSNIVCTVPDSSQRSRNPVPGERIQEDQAPLRSRYLSHLQTVSQEKRKEKEKPGLLSEELKAKVRDLTASAVVVKRWEEVSATLKVVTAEPLITVVPVDELSTALPNPPLPPLSSAGYEKYDFMRGMKISERTVRLMMMADGLPSSEILAYSPLGGVSA